MIQISEKEFEDKFTIVVDEKYGDMVEPDSSTDVQNVWTCLSGDYGLYFTNGYHHVNNLYNFITEETWEEEIEVKLENEDGDYIDETF